MSSQQYSCSACQAPLPVANRFQKTVSCPYCGTVNFIIDESIDLSGKTGTLSESASIFTVGKHITFFGKKGKISARLQYKYEDGFWDEFYLEMENGEKFWLQEDEGELTLFEKTSLTASIPKASDIFVGSIISVNGVDFFVTEKYDAHIQGFEGTLPSRPNTSETITCIDGNMSGKVGSLEMSPSKILYCEGEGIEYQDIEIS